jgi:hypothetical protein
MLISPVVDLNANIDLTGKPYVKITQINVRVGLVGSRAAVSLGKLHGRWAWELSVPQQDTQNILL